MKKLVILTIIVFCLFVTAVAIAQDDIKKYPSCKYCGMNREQFATQPDARGV